VTLLINGSTGASPYGFAFNPAGTVCYVADDRALPNGGVQKWTFNGSAWSLASTINAGITAGCRGLAVDFSGANPVIFATTSYGTISKATDNGSPVFATIDTAATNTVFRGITFAPVPPPPAAPNLVSPANNSTGNQASLSLVWNKSVTATSYRVQLATDAGFSNIILNDSTLTDSLRSVSGLNPLTNYWWRVKAKNAGGTSGFSGVFTFKTLGVPFTISGTFVPANGAFNQPTSINFRWPKTQDQTLSPQTILNYGFELATDSVSLANLVRDTTLTDTVKTVSGLVNSTNYYWRVKAKNQAGWSAFTNWLKLTTVPNPPAAPNLTLPANNSSGVSLTPVMVWDSLASATSYRIQIANDSSFSSMVKDTSGITSSHYNVYSGLLSNLNKYYWRVQAVNAGGNGPNSVIFNFTVGLLGISQNNEIPKAYMLYDNYPNPFNPSTKIKFDLPHGGLTVLKIYDVLGRLSGVVVSGQLNAGRYEIEFNASQLASGVYFYRLESEGFVSIKKMVIIK
jgi:hypothetical protein